MDDRKWMAAVELRRFCELQNAKSQIWQTERLWDDQKLRSMEVMGQTQEHAVNFADMQIAQSTARSTKPRQTSIQLQSKNRPASDECSTVSAI